MDQGFLNQPAPSLSAREREVLESLACGATDAETGQALGISLGTVRVYRQRMEQKLGTHGIAQTILVAGRLNLVDLGELADRVMASSGRRRF